MNGDRDILSIPDSPAWSLGVLHERERIIRLLQQRREDLCAPPCPAGISGRELSHRGAYREALQQAITAIREAG